MGLQTTATAQSNLVVVELYTSQGCSSCPPADGLLGEIAARDDILALAFHVDYWDYIGWKDQFADPKYTERQKSYARFHSQRSVYTPQMIVGGTDVLVGFKPMELADLIQAHARKTPGARIATRQRGDRLEVEVTGAARQSPALVILATYDESEKVDIGRGENAGRTLEYHNIVTSWTPLGEWSGATTFRATAQVPAGQKIAVIVQEKGPGPIISAARVR
jgi:hypothetical protein